MKKANEKYINFFKNEKRKPESNTKNNNRISLYYILKSIKKAFELYQKYLFTKYEKSDDYPLYKLVKNNWEKEIIDIEQSYFDDFSLKKKSKSPTKVKTNSPCVDGLFYLYLKELSDKTNEDYFFIIVKFVVLFREIINEKKKRMVTDDIIIKDKKEYTQLYNGEEIPKLGDDFLYDITDLNDNDFELESEELLKHFCYWLLINKKSSAFLI